MLLSVDREIWKEEASQIAPAYEEFGDKMPKELWQEYEALVDRLNA